MPRDDLLANDKEKARAKAEILRFFTRLAIFAALCWVLFGLVFGLAAVPNDAMAPRLCAGDLLLFSRLDHGTEAGQVLIINGSAVAEPDIAAPTQPVQGGPGYPLTLAEGELFLLCDARTAGADSRLYGAIPQSAVQGTALAALRRGGL